MGATTALIEAATALIETEIDHMANTLAHTAPGTIKPHFEPTTTANEKWQSHFHEKWVLHPHTFLSFNFLWEKEKEVFCFKFIMCCYAVFTWNEFI